MGRVGISYGALSRDRSNDMMINSRRTAWARRQEALAMRGDGKTFRQIGHEFGVTPERARQMVGRAWVERDKPPPYHHTSTLNESKIALFGRRWIAGETAASLATHAGVSSSWMSQLLHRFICKYHDLYLRRYPNAKKAMAIAISNYEGDTNSIDRACYSCDLLGC